MTAAAVAPLPASLPQRIGEVPRRWAAERPAAVAIVGHDGRPLTWGGLVGAVDASATMLRAHGVGPGDRVMVVAENCVELVALLFAVTDLDAWAVIVNPRMSPRELDVIRAHCRPRTIVLATAVAGEVATHAERLGAVPVAAGPLDGLAITTADATCATEPVSDAPERQVAVLVYTSGTTGRPKGVMLTHRNLLFVAAVSGRLRDLRASDRAYGALPIYHVYGLASMLLGTLLAGACLQLVARFSAPAALRAIAEDGLTVFQGVPAMYVRILEALAQDDACIRHRLRFLYAGGSPLDPTLKREVERCFGVPLHNGYGLTETSPTVSQTRLDAPRSDTSVGPPIPGIEVRIVGVARGGGNGREHGRGDGGAGALESRSGDVGELWVRGPNVMLGYYRDPAATADAITPDGWLRTGDLARQEPDGALFIVGRLKELIIRSGLNVYPVEVESVLNNHPAVSQSVVVGRPAESGNEEVVAFVELVPGRQASAQELLAHAASALAPYKRPCEVVLLPALPASATGKVLRAQLRALAVERAAVGRRERG